MSNKESIKYTIKQDGTVIEEVLDVKGGQCLTTTEEIENRLGDIEKREFKSEYYENVTLHLHQDQDQRATVSD
tara:strand:- start:3339 stop:3557 length:219 start_codon:yes stop_codon:yes gene_type:complete